MSENTAKRKLLLFGTDYGADVERLMSSSEEMQNDPGWIPGYSEAVRARDLAAIDPINPNFTTARQVQKDGVQLREHYMRQFGAPKPLPIELKWVRVAGMDGAANQNVRTDMMRYVADGYRAITLEELEAHGYGMPPAGTKAADGTIRRGDTALMAVDAERARANRLKKARENSEREQAAASDGITVEHSRQANITL